MSKPLNLSLLQLGLCVALGLVPAATLAAEPSPSWSADLNQIRQVAGMIPGPRPIRVNVIKFAESRRTKNFAVKGLPPSPACRRGPPTRSSTATER